VWVIARQHPGETMAEWLVEGMLDALLDPADAFGRQLLKEAVFYVVPNMNPDGSVRGNLRTNAAGANLNREWNAPTMERSPEVFLVKQKMKETGCDLFLDVHGDEGLPYVFVAGSGALPTFTAEQAAAEQQFAEDFKIASPDFQTEHGYPEGPYTDEVLTMGSPHITHAFGCLALTLELPFKDNANDPDPETGWDGARSARLGAAVLQPILRAIRRG
jgi:murein tripeptide amidase MpaA